jgi:hypothetical protein
MLRLLVADYHSRISVQIAETFGRLSGRKGAPPCQVPLSQGEQSAFFSVA